MSSQNSLRIQHSHRLIEAYCPSCGMFIAASPAEAILDLLERLHTCPPNTCDPDKASSFGRARIIKYISG